MGIAYFPLLLAAKMLRPQVPELCCERRSFVKCFCSVEAELQGPIGNATLPVKEIQYLLKNFVEGHAYSPPCFPVDGGIIL